MPKLSNGLLRGTGTNMRTEIRRERTVELIDECFRLDDLKRWKTAENEMPEDMLGIKYYGNCFCNFRLGRGCDEYGRMLDLGERQKMGQ